MTDITKAITRILSNQVLIMRALRELVLYSDMNQFAKINIMTELYDGCYCESVIEAEGDGHGE